MALKNLDQLNAEIDAAVHSNGPLGKTTAPGLNALLKSLAGELTGRPEAGAPDVVATLAGAAAGAIPSVGAIRAALLDEQYQQPFLFEGRRGDNSFGDNSFVATLSLAQARQLVQGSVPSVDVTAIDPNSGAPLALTCTYEAAQGTFALSGTDDGGIDFTLRQVGGGGGAAAPASFATLQGQPTDNPTLVAALAAATKVAAAPAPVVEVVFEAGFADAVGRTLGTRQAGTYASEQRQNVNSVSYQINGVAQLPIQSQPLKLASGDVLQIAITRERATEPAVLTLLA
jgi:hypothetical protein